MPTPADHTSCPYKGLQPYTEADRNYFFGRTRDEGIIISNLYAASVTVFYGASGVGKSSVLLAGAVPRLRQEPRDAVVAVFNRWQSEDFHAALKNEVAKQAGLSDPIDTALPLDEFLVQTQRALDLPLLVIFDQFEEYFLYHPPSPSADVFESSFARAVNRRGSQINFFLSLREDGLSKLDRFKSRIPTLMNNMLRLEHLNREAAKLAITQPLEEYNRVSGQPPMTIEPGLVRAILNDLQGASAGAEQLGQGVARTSAEGSTAPIETPFLQMVLTRLWEEERAAGSTTLRMQTFEALGRAAHIARTHLDTMMARLTDAERDRAASILRYMVTPSGSKIAQEAAALASWTDLTKDQVEEILTRLSGPDMRILRTMQAPGQPMLYEIFHDVLARAILDWRARYVQEQKQLEAEREMAIERAKAAEQLTRQRARAKRLGLVAAALSLLTLLTIVLAVIAYRGRSAARSKELAAYSTSMLSKDPQLSLLLAIKAVEAQENQSSLRALRVALNESRVSAVLGEKKSGARVADVAFSPDGNYVATASWDRTARVWDAKSGNSVSSLPGHQGQVNSVAFSSNGTYLLTAGDDRMLRVWEGWRTPTPTLIKTIPEEKPIVAAVFSPNEEYIVTGGGDGKVRMWDWKKDPVSLATEPLNVAGALAGLAPLPEATPTLPTEAGTVSLLAVEAESGPSPTVTPSPTPAPPPAKSIWGVAFSTDGASILVAPHASKAVIWKWKEKTTDLLEKKGHRQAVLDAAFSNDGEYAITGSSDGTAIVWKLRDPDFTKPNLNIVPWSIRGVAFSPDGNLVATASYDGLARVWEWRLWDPGKPPATILFRGHSGLVISVAFSPDGQFIVTGGDDGTARIWRTDKRDRKSLDGLGREALMKLAQERVARQLTKDEVENYLNQ